MSKPCFALVALLVVIAYSEVQGIQKYLGYPWNLNGILPRSYGPAWNVNQRLFPPRGEPEVKPKPEYKPELLPWWMRKGMLTPGSQPEWKPKPEYKRLLPPWWMRRGMLTPGSQPEWKPKPGYKPMFPIPANWLKGKYYPKSEPEQRPRIGIKAEPRPEWRMWPGKYYPKGEPEWKPKTGIKPEPRPEWRIWPGSYYPVSEPKWRPTPVYPPVFPVYPLPVMPRHPYPYSYPSFPLTWQPGIPFKQPPMPYAPIPPAYQYHVHPYSRFMKPSYPEKTAYPYNPMPKNPLYSNWLKQLLRLKARKPSNIETNNTTQSNASTSAANATITVRVEFKQPNRNIVIKNELNISKRPLKNILDILAARNECFKYTTIERNSRTTNHKRGEYVHRLCNTTEIYGSKYWLLYTSSGEKDLDVGYVPSDNTCIKIEYRNATSLYRLLH